ncbi:hypothetical protein P7C70_g7213, partial [Phenoliferia sp. Uapishka_3]
METRRRVSATGARQSHPTSLFSQGHHSFPYPSSFIMHFSYLSIPFFLIASTAFYFLIIAGGAHQVVPDCLLLVHAGKIRSFYTSLKPLDEVLGALVAFFSTSLSIPQGPPLISTFSSVYAVAILFMNLESLRPTNPSILRGSATPLVVGLLAQLFGAGIFLPLYFGVWFVIRSGSGIKGRERASKNEGEEQAREVKALLPALGLAFWPLVTFTINRGGIISKDAAEIATALWQLFPIWTFILHRLFIALPAGPDTRATSTKQSEWSGFRAVFGLTTLIYWIDLFSLFLHSPSFLSAIWSIFNFPLFNPTRGAESVHVFLLWDFFACLAGTGFWVVLKGELEWREVGKMVAVGVGCGPAAGLVWGAMV